MDELFQIIPYLQRFYGGNPVQWFDMESWMLELYLDQLPKVRAQEALWNARNTALGSGTMKQADQRHAIQALMRESGRAKTPQSKQEYEGQVAQMGLPVHYVN